MRSSEIDKPGEFIGVDEAAKLVGRSHWTVRRWLSIGQLTRYKSGSRVVVSRPQLLSLVQPRKEAKQ